MEGGDPDNSSSRSWRDQYELFVKFLSEGDNRFWTRFNVSLLINGGLIVAFSALHGLALMPTTILGRITSICIPAMGIIFSIIWIYITRAARAWQGYFQERIRRIEDKHRNELEEVIMPPKDGSPELKGSITHASYGYPITFLIFWGIILIFILIFW